MTIKNIINTELKGFTLDLIIEGLDEIISNGNFTTVLSEDDDVVADGVADKYAEKNFNIPDPNKSMQQQSLTGLQQEPQDDKGEFVGNTGGYSKTNVYANPKTLNDFDGNVRAVTDKNGNLYVAQLNRTFYHEHLAITVNKSKTKYANSLPEDTYGSYDEEVLLHRVGKTNMFGISDSYETFASMYPEIVQDLLKKAGNKNPQFEFYSILFNNNKFFGNINSSTNNNIVQGLNEDGDVVVDIVNDELNKNNCTLEENEVLRENTYKVYHGTNQKFGKFNFKNATQGIVWFTDSPESIEKGEHGGAGNSIIMTRYITLNKPAGWAEYEKYGLGQLQGLGYDGVILPQEGKTDYIVFSPKSISAKEPNDQNLSENGQVLNEGLSDILYHFTYIPYLISILKSNKFATSSNLGTPADTKGNKGKFFFFSTQRTKGMSGYGGHGNAAIVLDGRKLNQNFKGSPVDYWNWSTKRTDYKTNTDYINALKSEENEDRIVTDKPYIDNANKYIIETHVLVYSGHTDKKDISEIYSLAQGLSIPVYFYENEQDYKVQNKARALDPNSLAVPDSLDHYEGSQRNDTRDFLTLAPYIMLKNNDVKVLDALKQLLMQFLENSYYDDGRNRVDQYDEFWDKVKENIQKLNYNPNKYYNDERYRSISSDIHNNRGNPNPQFRELLRLLVADMRKFKAKNLRDYIEIKTTSNITSNTNENDTNENMSKSLKNTHDRTVKFTKDIDPPILKESQGEFTNVFHGTSLKGAENIQKYGVKINKSYGGYFGWGFYTAIDYQLAKNNYAEFSDDNATDEKGVILEFKISPNANILDLRNETDFKTWLPYSKAINQPNLYQVLVKHGIDGLYDNSFEGVVIYNPKVLTLVKLHSL
jgi:hypothetical protein